MSWTNLCVEAFCFADTDSNGNYPCGRDLPSGLCLFNGHCPHFAYSETTERDVSQFPSLRLIIKDRLAIWFNDFYWKMRWLLWDSLSFNRRKVDEFFSNIKSISSKDCPELQAYEDELTASNDKFDEWFTVVKREII